MLSERNVSTPFGSSWFDTAGDVNSISAKAAVAANDNWSPPLGTSEESLRPFMESVTLAAVLLLLILSCVIGNLFVIVAIASERDLRCRPQYYLIFSLAVADLIVGLIVSPLGAWSTVAGAWPFGVTLCDIWISVDVIVCTASILHLVAIALDRYWSVTDITYVQNRTPKRIMIMLTVIWMTSLLISLAPFAGWKDEGFKDRVLRQHVCLISQQISYQVFSTATAFYIPLIAIIVIYWKILRAAKKRFKRERDRRTVNRPPPDQSNSNDKLTPLILKKNKKILLQRSSLTNGEKSEKYRNIKSIGESSTSTQSEDDRTILHSLPEQETKLGDCTIQQEYNTQLRISVSKDNTVDGLAG
ncbi:putative serotonin receptor [Trichostrongylus colubriformis]|uniref:Serotonin receptor n=1 Tax=Trichostrongylus colubriformis TaxID=6319 RepID=A0AAN8ES42_TRICO